MKPLEKEEKSAIKLRYAAGLYKALKDSPFKSFRKLAKESGLEPGHIQKISTGKLDVTLSINVALSRGLGISYTEFSAYYDKVTEDDIQMFLSDLEKQKKLRGKEKLPVAKKGS
ncbi:hypothetical protein [Chitinophaga barathri]|uniref:XRE family transcriptional regulator n=1 Tax=Chitinophaga barathri TaxID=1647451 RepID=A0A3N4MHR1_9BACT|nr:hypothetical protein [Chitinophaga barathri]RPD42965.1 hypothetical protein EG028_01350 [Chitinophaga barathri]